MIDTGANSAVSVTEKCANAETLDLSQPSGFCRAIISIGFLDTSPDFNLMRGFIIAILKRLASAKLDPTLRTTLHLACLTILTREELYDCKEVVDAVYATLSEQGSAIEEECRGDIVRLVILTRVRQLMMPTELSFEDQPSGDTPEARIMQSDLFSGGPELHLFCLFEETVLV